VGWGGEDARRLVEPRPRAGSGQGRGGVELWMGPLRAAAVGPAWPSQEMCCVVWWLVLGFWRCFGVWIFWHTCQSVMPAAVSNAYICIGTAPSVQNFIIYFTNIKELK
jgi:hypothetical protein